MNDNKEELLDTHQDEMNTEEVQTTDTAMNEETPDAEGMEESAENIMDVQSEPKFDPLMQPEQGNKKKGIIAGIVIVAAIAALIVIIVMIVKKRAENKDDLLASNASTQTEQKQDATGEAASSNDESLQGAEGNTNTENAEVQVEEKVTYPPVTVTLGDYKGLNITTLPVEVSEEDIQFEIDNLLMSSRELTTLTERDTVKNGDIVTIDFVGSQNGVEFEGGAATNQNLEIGSGTFISGFEEQIIDHKVGETFDITVTIPTDYPIAELAGKEAVFKITLHSIGYYKTPELNDAFIASNTSYKTVDEYKEQTYNKLMEDEKERAETQKRVDAMNLAVANATFEGLSQDEIEGQVEQMNTYYEQYASASGMDLATFIQLYFGMDEATYQVELRKAAELQVKQNYFLSKLIEEENLSLSEEEYTTGIEKLAADNNAPSAGEFEAMYGREVIEQSILNEKAVKMITDSAVASTTE